MVLGNIPPQWKQMKIFYKYLNKWGENPIWGILFKLLQKIREGNLNWKFETFFGKTGAEVSATFGKNVLKITAKALEVKADNGERQL